MVPNIGAFYFIEFEKIYIQTLIYKLIMERPTFICNSSQITLLSDPIKFNMLKLQRNVGDPKDLD